jgi:DnaK suppressor protein
MHTESYQELLLQAKADALTNLGFRPDVLAHGGRLGEEDRAQISNEESVVLGLNNLEYEKLRQVKAALQRIDDGDYGLCDRCGEPIPPRRLQVLPWATYCVPCQEETAAEEADDFRPGQLFEDIH